MLRGDVAAEVQALKNQPGGTLLVEGSAQLVHTLAQHNLVDEYRLMVFPVILGQGKRAFPDSMPAPRQVRHYQLAYRRLGRPAPQPHPRADLDSTPAVRSVVVLPEPSHAQRSRALAGLWFSL